ncbi:exoribonuclease, VacB/RNB family protein [Lentisphaera araneosa HTCC2155]|uniref:Exoribonuclease, VacB/RNB family protein n=1 Tax=Lentisphaera araneosa HTCC2155 TaxID=313628 RepID=A6DIQ3_9BACT|nr:RNB domain-containing ribonuclease [Lentisphaera araneosa]EDM28339.1 exoribonuclease, VacB/RNB family protein [Lentisphaera araneosa HTCC2155]
MTEEFYGLSAYTDGNQLRLAYVLGIEKKKAKSLIASGRTIPLPLKNVLFSFNEKVSEDDFRLNHPQYEEKIKSLAADVDLGMLWEMLEGEECKVFTLDELCDFYFSELSDYLKAGLFDVLSQDIVYFKRRLAEFTIRDQEQVEAILKSREKKRLQEEYEAELGPWVQSVLESDEDSTVEVPGKFKTFVGQLGNLIWLKQSSDASRFLDKLIGKSPLRLKAVEFLMKTGQISKDCDEHLVIAGIRPDFSQKLLAMAEELDFDSTGRNDLGEDFYCFSIDDESTSDVDDVLSVEYLENDLFKIGIHIADVSAYIAKASTLDLEAEHRATSIYLPTGTVNMFPAELATHKASLLPGSPKPALSYYATLTSDGELRSTHIERSLIQVSEKLSYRYCDGVLEGDEEAKEDLKKDLDILANLADELILKRQEKGAITFNRPENKITIVDGVVDITEVRAHSKSRALVGEFMILANNLGAQFCRDNEIPALYRVQEKSDEQVAMPETYDPVSFDAAIKCMKKSRMTPYPSDHAGLGLDCYTQFTSPIRRYSDLMMQRQLIAFLEGRDLVYTEDELLEIKSKAESRLGEVRDVQRQSENFWLYTYLEQSKIGETYLATVVNHLNGGLLVELDGLTLRLKLNHGKKLEIGTRLEVKIQLVDPKLNHAKLSLESILDE